jgi:hypothetical protein
MSDIEEALSQTLGDDDAFCERLAELHEVDLWELRTGLRFPKEDCMIKAEFQYRDTNGRSYSDFWDGFLFDLREVCNFLVSQGYEIFLQETGKYHFTRDHEKIAISYEEGGLDLSYHADFYTRQDIQNTVLEHRSKRLQKKGSRR